MLESSNDHVCRCTQGGEAMQRWKGARVLELKKAEEAYRPLIEESERLRCGHRVVT